jgi:hypothetical protein
MILKVAASDLPWLNFEWHPDDHRLYVLKSPPNGSGVAVATPFLEDVNTEHEAKQGINAFIAGYKEQASEPDVRTGIRRAQHHTIILDTGILGAHHGS